MNICISHISHQICRIFKTISISQLACRIIQPICLGGFVAYFSRTEPNNVTLNDAYWYASGIIVSTALLMCYNPYALRAKKTSRKIQVACSGLVYRKLLQIKKSSMENGSQIINLISNDLMKLELVFTYLVDVFIGPIQTVIFFLIIYVEIGIAAVIGMAFLASFIPLQGKDSSVDKGV